MSLVIFFLSIYILRLFYCKSRDTTFGQQRKLTQFSRFFYILVDKLIYKFSFLCSTKRRVNEIKSNLSHLSACNFASVICFGKKYCFSAFCYHYYNIIIILNINKLYCFSVNKMVICPAEIW